MRVWFVNQYAIPPSEPGGTRHHTLAAKLAQRGHETAVIASRFSHVRRVDRHPEAGRRTFSEEVDGVSWHWLNSPPYAGNSAARAWNMSVFGYRVWRDAKLRSLPRPDVVVGSTPPLPAAYGALRLARSRRAGFVAEIRDLWPRALEELGGYGHSHPAMALLRGVERRIYDGASRVVTLLPNSRDYLMAQGVAGDRITLMPNGIDLASIPPATPPPSREGLTVMYAGTHGFANGLDLVLDAARVLLDDPGIRFRLVGDGPDKARLQDRARRERLQNVVFDDPVPKARIHEVLAEADAFILPLSDAQVFDFGLSPNKLFDYLAAARPVIFAAHGHYGDVPVADVGVAVTSVEGTSIAAAVRELAATDPDHRAEMGAAGRRYVEDQPDLGAMALELEAVLESVVLEARSH